MNFKSFLAGIVVMCAVSIGAAWLAQPKCCKCDPCQCGKDCPCEGAGRRR